jgi:hypothetical protein
MAFKGAVSRWWNLYRPRRTVQTRPASSRTEVLGDGLACGAETVLGGEARAQLEQRLAAIPVAAIGTRGGGALRPRGDG